MLSEEFLQNLVTEADNEDIRAIALAGSYASGKATEYSDVDLMCVWPDHMQPRKRFLNRNDRLISLAVRTIAGMKNDLAQPERAIWAVPAYRNMRVLKDKDGALSHYLAHDLAQFRWETLQEEANGLATFILMCDAEFVYKMLNNLQKGNIGGIAYVAARIFDGATHAIMVQRGVMISTDSLLYEEAEVSVGHDHLWTYYHRLLSGVEPEGAQGFSTVARGKISLLLYRETAHLLDPVLSPTRRPIVEQALRLIERADLSY